MILTFYVAGCRRRVAALSPISLEHIWPLLLFGIRLSSHFLTSRHPSLSRAGAEYAALLSCIDWRRDGGVGQVRGGHEAGD